MRASVPIPGDRWPHDMVITVDDEVHSLIELLWIREASKLQPIGDDLPPLLIDPPAERMGAGEEFDVQDWQAAWPALWSAAVSHAGTVHEAGLLDALHRSADRSAERAELLARITGPSWRDQFDDAVLDERYSAWNTARFHDRMTRPNALESPPERLALDALIPAWRRGLTKIVTIPCRGEYTRTIGEHTLMLTEATRDDAARFGDALSSFG